MQAVMWIIIFVLEEVGGGVDVFVWVFVKGHALIHSGKWEGHEFFRKQFPQYPGPTPPPPNEKRTFPYSVALRLPCEGTQDTIGGPSYKQIFLKKIERNPLNNYPE